MNYKVLYRMVALHVRPLALDLLIRPCIQRLEVAREEIYLATIFRFRFSDAPPFVVRMFVGSLLILIDQKFFILIRHFDEHHFGFRYLHLL
jgi:hypothetical protein